jgi:CHU_C Type IX secretion signal domain
MKDSVNNLFQQRFQGHEAPVDAGVWEGIQQHLAATAPAADAVNDLFRERFQGHEAPVDPSAWAHISSQLGHSAVAGSAGAVWAWVAAGVAAVVVTTAAVLWEPSPNSTPQDAVVAENSADAPQATVELKTSSNEEVTLPVSNGSSIGTPLPEPAGKAVVKTREDLPSRRKEVQSTATSVPTEAAENAPPDHAIGSEREGPAVVSGIITVLEEQVKLQPVTAQPEPGIVPTSNSVRKDDTTTPSENGLNADVIEPATPTPLPKLFMPNTFTPNGDGVNDTYMVEGEAYAAVFLRVYSLKSNALVFSTNSGEPWTGDGCEDGMYMVAIEAHTAEGRTTTEGKVVWLNRNRIN